MLRCERNRRGHCRPGRNRRRWFCDELPVRRDEPHARPMGGNATGGIMIGTRCGRQVMNWFIRGIFVIVIGAAPPGPLADDVTTPEATAAAFRSALEGGREQAVLALLVPELLVYESGDRNRSRTEYAAHHLRADMAFLAQARVRVLEQVVSTEGSSAWVATRSRIVAPSADLISTETLMLRRTPDGWRIWHIHWSSRKARREDG
ncbi:MAG: DUF4440 domain-containing protein [Betaproteobacteria bacterium]|nr:MAG: DUF4440 domain-containing protein [Betaproteobacteria bacterium]